MSSLSCEYEKGCLFVCSAFEVPRDAGWSPESAADVVPSWGGGGGGFGDTATGSNWIPSQVFLEREEEFEIVMVPHVELTLSSANDDEDNDDDDNDNDSWDVSHDRYRRHCRRQHWRRRYNTTYQDGGDMLPIQGRGIRIAVGDWSLRKPVPEIRCQDDMGLAQ